MQDAEERREKGVTMNSILNSLFTVLIGFFFSRVFEEATVLAHKSEREHRKRAEKRKREFEEEHTTQTRKRKKISHTFLVEKCLPKLHHFSSKHQRVLRM